MNEVSDEKAKERRWPRHSQFRADWVDARDALSTPPLLIVMERSELEEVKLEIKEVEAKLAEAERDGKSETYLTSLNNRLIALRSDLTELRRQSFAGESFSETLLIYFCFVYLGSYEYNCCWNLESKKKRHQSLTLEADVLSLLEFLYVALFTPEARSTSGSTFSTNQSTAKTATYFSSQSLSTQTSVHMVSESSSSSRLRRRLAHG